VAVSEAVTEIYIHFEVMEALSDRTNDDGEINKSSKMLHLVQLERLTKQTLFWNSLGLNQFDSNHLLLCLYPLFLVLGHERVTLHLFLVPVVIVDHNSDEQVQDKDLSYDDKRHKVHRDNLVVVLLGLKSDSFDVHPVVHHI
jgi:hypothetical protein